jgi:hypothetical protein
MTFTATGTQTATETMTGAITATLTAGPSFTATATAGNGAAAPDGGFILYPNPVFDAVYLSYDMAGAGNVKIRIYNEAGALVIAFEERKPGGPQISSLNVLKLAPGVYFCLAGLSCDSGKREKSGIKKFIVLR